MIRQNQPPAGRSIRQDQSSTGLTSQLYYFYLDGTKVVTDTLEGFHARTSTQWKVDDVVASDSWNSSKKPIKKMTSKTWIKIYARWGWTCELATSAQNPSGSRVRSSELIVGMVTGLEGELYISYYHPATSQELTILAKHFGSPLVLQEEAGRIVKIRYPERLVRKSAGTADLRGGITLGVSPSEELDFDAPSEGVWPIGPFGMCLDRYVDSRGQEDYFRKGVEVSLDHGGDEHP